MNQNDPSALKLKMNWTGDLTPEEYAQLITLDQAQANANKTTLSMGRGLGNGIRATTVDHFEDGFMHKVKNQGGCGSCWTFAANTALEGFMAKNYDDFPIHVSEQQIVDCTLTTNADAVNKYGDYHAWGCQGGWMSYSWDFHKDHGFMVEDDYKYFSGNTGREGACQHKPEKVKGRVTKWGQIQSTVADMKEKAKTHPLAVAVDAGRAAW